MRNLINFIWRHNFTLLFLFLELVAFALLVQTNSFQKSSFLNFTSSVSGNVFNAVNNVSEYFALKRLNEELAMENAKLQTLNKNAFVKVRGNVVLINDSLYKQQYKYLGAKVVNSMVNKRNNYLILNRGSEQGVEPEMGVISSDGIVGVVRDVSPNFCSVISVLHKNTRVSSKLKKNDYFGILTWEGKNPDLATLNDIPRHVELSKGDSVVTRGSSTIYPEGIMIGRVSEFEAIPGSNFYEISVELSTDYHNVAYVYIVKNIMKKEQKQLEAVFEEEND